MFASMDHIRREFEMAIHGFKAAAPESKDNVETQHLELKG